MKAFRLFFLAALLNSLCVPYAMAWSSFGGSRIVDAAGDQVDVRAAADGSGGFFVLFTDYNSQPGLQKARVLRVSPSGNPAPGWPAIGVAIGGFDQEKAGDIVSDGAGGAFLSWTDVSALVPDQVRMLVARVDGTGSLRSGWPIGGRVFLPHGVQGSIARLSDDSAGGRFVLWKYAIPVGADLEHGLFVSRLDSLGSPVASWPDTGARVVASGYVRGRPAMLRASDGAIWIGWSDAKEDPAHQLFKPYLRRLLPDGPFAPGWTGASLSADPVAVADLSLVADVSGGVFLLSPVSFFAHSDSTGAPVAGWDHAQPYSAVSIPPASMSSDGAGGLYALSGFFQVVTYVPYQRGRVGVSLRHFGADGLHAPSWPDTFRVLDLGPLDDTHASPVSLVPDGAGGTFAFWNHVPAFSAPSQLYAVRYASSGAAASGWQSGGALVDSSGASLGDGVALADGLGGGYLVYSGGTTSHGTYDYDIWADRVVNDGPVPAQASLVSASVVAGAARLEWWSGASASTSYRVERRDAASPWAVVGTVAPTGDGRVTFEDRSVSAGQRLGYRLSAFGGAQSFGEVWLEVPSAAAFGLRRIQSVESRRALRVAFDLPRDGEPRLRLFDVAGRLRASLDLGIQAAGSHEFQLDTPRLEAGLYFARLEFGAQVASTRVVVTR